jgi:hypothetical protein
MPISTSQKPFQASTNSQVTRIRTSLYVHRFFNEIGDGLIKVFVPILIYQRTGLLSACIIWLASYYILQSLLNLSLKQWLVANPLWSLWLRILPVILTQVLLISGRTDGWLVAGLTCSTALANVFYWVPLNYLMSASIGKGKAGSLVGWIRASSVIGKTVAPILGGWLVVSHGIVSSVILATVMYALSLLPLLGLRRVSLISKIPPVPLTESDASLWTYLRAYFIAGVWDSAEVFWALHVFVISATFVDAGLASGLLQLGVILANIITGWLTDKKRWWIPAVITLGLYGLLWMLRPTLLEPWSIFAISIGAGLMRPGFEIPVFTSYLNAAQKSGQLERWLAFREVAIKTGGLCLVTAVAGTGNFSVTPFVIAGLASGLFFEPLSRVAGRP